VGDPFVAATGQRQHARPEGRAYKHLPRRPDRLLDLPERAAAIETKGIQSPDLRQRRQLVAADAGRRHEIVEGSKTGRTFCTQGTRRTHRTHRTHRTY
jgi:hypothetical protein